MHYLNYSLAICLLLSFFQCDLFAQGIRGEGSSVERTLELDNFDKVGLSIPATVYVEAGNTQSVRVEGQANLIENLKTEVRGGSWNIGWEEQVRSGDRLTIYITLPELNGAAVSSSGKLIGKSPFRSSERFEMAVSGSGLLQLEIEAPSVQSAVSGSGSIEVSGKTTDVEMAVSGSGSIRGMDLKADNCQVAVSGSGNCYITAGNSLEAAVSGSGGVFYGGNPRVKARISGSGKVEPRS